VWFAIPSPYGSFNSVIATAKLNQLIVADFLASGSYDRHLRKLKTALKNQVSQSAAAISRYFPAGTRISSPRGGYVIWVELPDGVDGMTRKKVTGPRHNINKLHSNNRCNHGFLRLQQNFKCKECPHRPLDMHPAKKLH